MLEAIVITTIMLSAIAFVATYEQPITPEGNARASLLQAAEDTLAILAETPVESNFGDDALSAYIAECLNARCGNLSSRLARLAPTGASYALYVSNGYDTYPVYVMGEPSGEAVSAARPFEPRWSGTFVSTATDIVSATDPLLVYELPIFNSNVVDPGGSHLVIKVKGQRSDTSDYVLIGSAMTVAASSTDATALAASLYFVDDAGNPMAVHNLSSSPDTTRELKLRLEETQGGRIPAGVEVAIETPRGWSAKALAPDNDGWSILANATDRNGSAVGSTVRALLNASLTSAAKDLRLQLTYHGDVLDYYPFHARLTRGALASASILVRGEDHASVPTLASPIVAASVPAPMGRGALTTWTIGAYIPVNETGATNLSSSIEVTSIEIREQEGAPIFGAVSPLQSMGGQWITGLDNIAWYGSLNLSYDSLLNLTFRVAASGTAGPLEARAAFVPPVTFDAFEGKLVQRTGWGFHKGSFLPRTSEYGGYDPATGSEGLALEHDISTDAVYRSTELPGRSNYSSAVVGSLEEALYGSYVQAQDNTVPVGGEVIIDANVQSILFALSEAGQQAGVTMRFYPPWAGDDRTAIFEQSNLDQGLLTGDVSQMVVLDLNNDGYPDPVVGTTNGRVVAYHGLTGRRLQGNSFTAPVTSVSNQQLVTKITAMDTITLYGEQYIVVTTDKYSDGVFVLAKDLSVKWRYPILNADTNAIDTRNDFTGDGQPEIVVARTVERISSKDTILYVLRAVQGDPILRAVTSKNVVGDDAEAFWLGPGTPSTVLTTARSGPFGELPGINVPVQTTADPGIRVTANAVPPLYESGALSTPRAGVVALNQYGDSTSTLFGAPATVLRPYDFGGDAVDDLLFGGSSGYVVLANGKALTQPLYSYVMAPSTAIISADTRSSLESYVLTDSGVVLMTDDGWNTNWGPDDVAAGAKAISSNAPNSFWLVGSANKIWKSSIKIQAPIPSRASMPPMTEILPAALVATKDGAAFNFVLSLHDFRDVWFRGNEGWVVGTKCVGLCASDPIIMKTTDGGSNWVIESGTGPGTTFPNGAPTQDLNRIRFTSDGTGYVLGDAGTLYRRSAGSEQWLPIATGTTYDLLDMACRPSDLDKCMIVGEGGAVFNVTNARGSPAFENLTGTLGLPSDGRTIRSVGFQQDDRAFIGSENMVLMRVGGANWTTLSLNYIENTAYAVNGLGNGYGYIYGGNASNGRIWSLHDYHTQSQAETVALGDLAGFPANAVITDVTLRSANVSTALQNVTINVSTNGDNWLDMGSLHPSSLPIHDARTANLSKVSWAAGSGRDLRIRVQLNTSGDSTIMSPQVRSLTFSVNHTNPVGEKIVTLDFSSDAWKNADKTTADWSTADKALRQPLVPEYWTRNVSGAVLDLQTGFDVVGDTRKDVWVATGDTLSENSPDHVIYAGGNLSKVIDNHYRVYLLDGLNGTPARVSVKLDGEVRKIRISDNDSDQVPETVFAATYNGTSGHSRLYALDPRTLDERWNVTLTSEATADMELGTLVGGHTAVYSGTQRSNGVNGTSGHVWQTNSTSRQTAWRIIPDEMGKYTVKTKVEPKWLFGPYVVEVEVEWTEPHIKGGEWMPDGILRSARFYDHFMVTPPDVVSVPTPVYTARLLMWMRDWGG